MERTKSYNSQILLIMSILISIGLVMVYSSSAIMSNFKYGSSTLFILKQFIGVVLGTILFIIFSNFDYNKLRKYMIPLLIFTLVLLVMVLVFGKSVAGAKRWLKIGPLNFQPSELAKITVILYLAWYIDRRKSKIKNFKEGILKP
ncbi:MAG TPA: stage V sporulation protein E, partial [Elusimicrobia bacterium]|nr:stage V sporulation protein E [Elusimicrobiota bacterium]